MTEPPNTEAELTDIEVWGDWPMTLEDHLATVREALSEYAARLRDTAPERRALPALDAIASELERRNVEIIDWKLAKSDSDHERDRWEIQAQAAEAELKRVRAERDNWKHEYDEACKSLTKRVHQGADAVRREKATQARLNRAVEALREITEYGKLKPGHSAMAGVARAALAEIEESG